MDNDQLNRIERTVNETKVLAKQIVSALNIVMSMEVFQMKTQDDVLAAIGEQTTVEDGLLIAFDELRAAVTAAAGNQAKIDAAFDAVKANTAKMAAKLVENTGGSTGGASPTE